jgi:hypothetical protein
MKMRMLGNSIRLRLGRSEANALHRQGRVIQAISFGSGPRATLEYEVRSVAGASGVSARLCENRICVEVPSALVDQWATSAQVAIDARQPVAQGQTLCILIEKDFKCLDQQDPNLDVDAFPRPSHQSACL